RRSPRPDRGVSIPVLTGSLASAEPPGRQAARCQGALATAGQIGPSVAGRRSLQRTGEIRHQERRVELPAAATPHDRAAAELGSTIMPDSATASNWPAGTFLSSVSKLSGHSASSVPLKNQLLPLSARSKP